MILSASNKLLRITIEIKNQKRNIIMINKYCSIYINFVHIMKSPFLQKLDSDHIRQGLISIRNTQLQLLNELKYQTQILKHYSPPSTTSEYSQKTYNQQKKVERFPPFSIESKISIQQNDSKFRKNNQQLSVFNEKELKDEINYLKNQNKLANSNFQRLKKSMQDDQQKINELQVSINILSKFYCDILLQILDDCSIEKVRQYIVEQNSKESQLKCRLKPQVDNILKLLNQNEKKKEESNSLKVKQESEKNITSQLIDLKSQLSFLISSSNQLSKNSNGQELQKMKELVMQRDSKIEQLEKSIKKLEAQNRQISKFWDKQLNERKKVMSQLQKSRKQSSSWDQKQKRIIIYAKNMEDRALYAEKMLKDKGKTQAILKENVVKLTETLNMVRESNQTLRKQVKSLDQSKQKRYITLSQQKSQLENGFKMMTLKNQKLSESKETEIQSLRNHIAELKKNQQSLKQFDRKFKDNDLMQQDIYWKKVNIIRANATIDHLWQVKEVQYENMNQLIRKMKN